ncbi:hypothetical protein QVD17_41839 [Tagetes erecta]|uniref:Uncharacterized protein n=1 Tax=Tagetes erecta TaxID=13708 RepID=A0AAD8NFW9_TARER|nr:hypothetical protein QVD17_41839 [Tagetes erecta]
MGGGAWPFLVGGAICLVNSVNERDLSLLTSYVEVCDALRCSGPHARYTDVFNEYIALADRPGKSLKFHRDGDRSLQLLVLNEEFLVSKVNSLWSIEQCRQGKSAKWIRNLGKRIGSEGWARGSLSRIRRLSVDCSSCFRGESGSPCAGRGTDWERPLLRPSPGVEQPTQNWYGQGESDCLIKTKHCDGPCGC